MNCSSKILIYIIFYFYISILLIHLIIYIYVTNTRITVISKSNTLCYSWLPFTKYLLKNTLCKINCSYTRLKPFPSNSAFHCEDIYTSIYNNVSYDIYVFNTSTYGKYNKQYRFFYGNSQVYYTI